MGIANGICFALKQVRRDLHKDVDPSAPKMASIESQFNFNGF